MQRQFPAEESGCMSKAVAYSPEALQGIGGRSIFSSVHWETRMSRWKQRGVSESLPFSESSHHHQHPESRYRLTAVRHLRQTKAHVFISIYPSIYLYGLEIPWQPHGNRNTICLSVNLHSSDCRSKSDYLCIWSEIWFEIVNWRTATTRDCSVNLHFDIMLVLLDYIWRGSGRNI